MSGVKFSQFLAGGEFLTTDTIVGLRSGTNEKMSFGTGLHDAAGYYLFKYLPGSISQPCVNYPTLMSATATNPPQVLAQGSDTNINLYLAGQGTGVVWTGGTNFMAIPAGNTAQALTGFAGGIRYNTDTDTPYYWNNALGEWVDFSTGSPLSSLTFITQTDETAVAPNSVPLSGLLTGFLMSTTSSGALTTRVLQTVSNSRITIANNTGTGGNPSFDLATTAVTPATYTNATVTFDAYGRATSASSGSSGSVSSVTGDGTTITASPTTGAVNLSIYSGYVGQTSITTVGDISTGLWEATEVGVPYGGTGSTSFTEYMPICGGTSSLAALQSVSASGASSGYVLTFNSSTTLPTWQAPSGGGVSSITGTANEITASASTGAITLSTPSTFIAPGTIAAVTSISSPTYLLTGSSSGTISILGQAAAGTYNFNLPTTAGTSGYVLTSAGGGSSPMTWTAAGGGSGTSLSDTITQVAHGFSVQQLVYLSGTTYTLAIATSAAAAEVVGMVSSVTSSSVFVLTTAGYVTGLSGLTAGTVYWLSDGTAGLLTATQPTTVGNIQKPVFVADTTTSGYLINYRGEVIPTALSTPFALSIGGTGASLTASNGGIVYSNASTLGVLSGTATANQVFLSGASTTPAWSTATYPPTTTVNQLLYSSSSNVIAGLGTADSGVLITSSGGVPSISTTIPATTQANITATGALAAGSLASGFTVVTGALGGTGVANTGSTFTMGGNVAFSGAYTFTGTLSANTAVTFPTSGTLATTSAIPSFPLSLANGGTAAGLTATAGGLVYSGSSVMGISAAGSSGALIQSGGTSAPTWTTSTYPATNAINTLLYASSANAMAALATAVNGVLITSSGGAPSISTTLPTAVQDNIVATGALAAGSLAAGFTVVSPPLGGTGIASWANTYSPLISGTTTTGNVQTVAVGGATLSSALTYQGSGVAPAYVTIPGYNLLINGSAQIWQYYGNSVSVAASTTQYTGDMWQLLTNANQACTVSQVAYVNNGAKEYLFQVQRNSGQTGTGVIRFCQSITIDRCSQTAGNKVTLSFLARRGATFSATGDLLAITVYAGTGTTNKSGINGAFTGSTAKISTTQALGTTAGGTYYSFTTPMSLATSVTQLAVEFSYTPVGTASTTDYFQIGSIQLENSINASPFQDLDFNQELIACQRYLQKSFPYATPVAQNSGTYVGAAIYTTQVASTTTGYTANVYLPVPMLTAVAPTFYNPSAADAKWYNITTSADSGTAAATYYGTNNFAINNPQVTGDLAGALMAVHWTLDARLT